MCVFVRLYVCLFISTYYLPYHCSRSLILATENLNFEESLKDRHEVYLQLDTGALHTIFHYYLYDISRKCKANDVEIRLVPELRSSNKQELCNNNRLQSHAS